MIAMLFGLLAGPMQIADAPRRPDAVSITVPPGRCRIALNGRPIALARLRKETKVWAETQPEVHFQPSPQAEYRCVDRVLRALHDAGMTKVGLLVDEQAAEGAR